MKNDLPIFFEQLLKRPYQISAIAPSSAKLAAAMTATLEPSRGDIIEIGAGTGRITQAIIDRGIPAKNIHAIEMNPNFCAVLQKKFPDINLYQCSATEMAELSINSPQAVVSGLPLLSMPLGVQTAIIEGAFKLLGNAGKYIQFTYGPKPPIKAELRNKLNLSWTKSSKIWRNLPPASVYHFSCP